MFSKCTFSFYLKHFFLNHGHSSVVTNYVCQGAHEVASIVQISGSQPEVRAPLGVREKLTGGTTNFKNHFKQVYLGRIFDLGGTPRG